MADEESADIVVVGLGPGGEEVANELARAGLDVVGVERGLVGGECPYWGCVPSKVVVRAADLLAEARRVEGQAGTAEVTPSWDPVARRIREVTGGWDDTAAVERLEGHGGRLVRGAGRLVAPDVVEVAGGPTIRARRGVVVATGSHPADPPIEGLDRVPRWTNREALEATELPGSLAVLGGGAIGAELAQALARFGVATTVVEVADRILAAEEPEASALVAGTFAREGIDVRTGSPVASAATGSGGAGVALTLGDGSVVRAERLLVATGRAVDVAATGLAVVGVDPSARAVPVDEHLRVAAGVWAVGDVTGQGAFTHVAVHQARIVVADVLGRPHAGFEARAVPRVTFTDPEVGSVGLTEARARDAGVDVAVGRADLGASARGWIHGPGGDGLVKLVADRAGGTLVGGTCVGPTGGEVLGLIALAVHARVPVGQLATMVYAYPTFHRAVGDAVRDLEGQLA